MPLFLRPKSSPGGFDLFAFAGLGSQAAVLYEHDAPEVELLLVLGNLRSQCVGISRIAKTSTATGQPSLPVSRPKTIYFLSRG